MKVIDGIHQITYNHIEHDEGYDTLVEIDNLTVCIRSSCTIYFEIEDLMSKVFEGEDCLFQNTYPLCVRLRDIKLSEWIGFTLDIVDEEHGKICEIFWDIKLVDFLQFISQGAIEDRLAVS